MANVMKIRQETGAQISYQSMLLLPYLFGKTQNRTDPDGKTHHVMVTFLKDGDKITKAVGKVKRIAPSGKELLGTLKDFGDGVFAANFKIDEAGKWGVICLFKDSGGKHTVKFWYEHHKM